MTPFNYSPLLTDFYQLTMAYGYWKLNMHEQEAVFHMLYRKNPFNNPFAIACGLGSLIDYLNQWRFQPDDLAYLQSLKNPDGQPLFPTDFLDYLAKLKFTCHLDAIPEGTVVFPNEPLIRIQGPLLQCQLLESPLLNLINFQTLIATKAARVYRAAGGKPIIEFGMRRAQGPDGALSASRAAYIGGCDATSHVLAGKLYDIPVRGTHAHSWVTAFDSEREAFEAYANVMPENCVLLVDTYHTLEGVKNAIEVGKQLRKQGIELQGIRLDSGDLADLSIKARKLLDDAGFKQTGIIASNSLDEYVIQDLNRQGAQYTSWGVGTYLVTAYDHPALDGVYKLSALRDKTGVWQYKLKLSEQSVKTSNPGRHQVRRFFYDDQYMVDVIYDLNLGINDTPEAISFKNEKLSKQLDDVDAYIDLLEPVFVQGKCVQQPISIHEIRKKAIAASTHYYQTHGDADYVVGLEKNLYDLKQSLIKKL